MIAGRGFIDLETAENLRELGMEVTLVQGHTQLMTPFDSDMSAFLHAEVRKHGVNLVLDRRVDDFEIKGGKTYVKISGENSIPADLTILAIGVVPDTRLAKNAGLELSIKDSIKANDRMETSYPDIYAVGTRCSSKTLLPERTRLFLLPVRQTSRAELLRTTSAAATAIIRAVNDFENMHNYFFHSNLDFVW